MNEHINGWMDKGIMDSFINFNPLGMLLIVESTTLTQPTGMDKDTQKNSSDKNFYRQSPATNTS